MSYSQLNPAWDRMLRTREFAENQPWRCKVCGEAVNKTTKRDCACTRKSPLAGKNNRR